MEIKSQLSKLPKEILIEIIEKQNLVEYYTYEQLEQLNKKIYKIQNETRQTRDKKIREKIVNIIPKQITKVSLYPPWTKEINWRLDTFSMKDARIKIQYISHNMNTYNFLEIEIYPYKGFFRISFSERENGDIFDAGNRGHLLEVYPQLENLVNIMESSEMLVYLNFSFDKI